MTAGLRITAAIVAAVCGSGSVVAQSPANAFTLQWNDAGVYTIAVAGWSSFTLNSVAPTILVDGQEVTLEPAAGSTPGAFTGQDGLGTYSGLGMSWQVPGSSSPMPALMTTIALYDDVPAVLFDSYFMGNVSTGSNYSMRTDVASSFPAFAFPSAPQPVGLMQWFGTFIDDDVNGPLFARWGDASTPLAAGHEAGPIVFFDPAGNHSVVFSPYSNFMAASIAQSPTTRALRAGLLGSLTVIPPGSDVSFIMYYGSGINAAATGWGSALQQRYGKNAGGGRLADYTASNLVYNTDQ